MSDQVKNFAYSTTSAAVTSGATSFSVQSGHGSRFPATSGGAYNLVVYDPKYPNASVAYQNSAAEIIRVTTRSIDTFSVITRAQEGTSAIAWGADWRVEMNVTAKNFEEASSTLSGLVSILAQSFTGVKNFLSNITVGAASTTLGNVRFYNTSNAYTTDVASGLPSGDVILTLPTTTGDIALTTQGVTVMAAVSRVNYAINTTGYECPFVGSGTNGGSPTSTDSMRLPLPAGVVKNMRVRFNTNTVANGVVVTILKDGSDTSITASLAYGVTQNTDLVNSVSWSAGEAISIRIDSAAGGSGTMSNPSISFEFHKS